MRYQSVHARRDRTLEVAMTPMIDVVFMLLIFFVWTASFQVAELILPSSIVSQEGQGTIETNPEFEDLERVVVRMGWNGSRPTWLINDTPVADLNSVAVRLQTVARVKATLPVMIDPDPPVPLGHVIDVYDLARIAGFENVQFAAPADQ